MNRAVSLARLLRMSSRRIVASFLLCLDALLLFMLVYLSFGQQRIAFGRTTGLVTVT